MNIEILITVVFLLGVVTVVGHLIWVLLAFMIKLIFGYRPPERWQDELKKELNLSSRYLLKLVKFGKISQQEYDRLRDVIDADYQRLGSLPPYRFRASVGKGSAKKLEPRKRAARENESPPARSAEPEHGIVFTDSAVADSAKSDVAPMDGSPKAEPNKVASTANAQNKNSEEIITAALAVPSDAAARETPVTIPNEKRSRESQRQSKRGKSPNQSLQPSTPAPWDFEDDPVPAERSGGLWEVLYTFMQKRNIRWGELVSGILIVGSAVGLVLSLRAQLEQTIPYFPALLFMLITAGIHGAGLYTLKKWKLAQTSRGVLIIGMLLIPLSFLAACLIGGENENSLGVLSPQYIIAVVVGLTSFGLMSVFSSKALTPRYWINMTVAVMGCSIAQLIINRATSISQLLADNLMIAPATVAVSLAMVPPMTFEAKRLRGAKNRLAFLTLIGVALFSLVVAALFLISKSEAPMASLSNVAPSLSLVASILIGAGLAVGTSVVTANPRDRIVGLVIAISGLVAAVALFGVAFPNPVSMLYVSLVVGVSSFLLAIRCRAFSLQFVSMIFLGASVLLGVHLGLGNFQQVSAMKHVKLLFSATSSITLFGYSVFVFAISHALAKKRIKTEFNSDYKKQVSFAQYGASVVGVLGTLLAIIGGFINPESWLDSMMGTLMLAIVVTGFAVFALRRSEPFLGFAASIGIFGFFGYALAWNDHLYTLLRSITGDHVDMASGILLLSGLVCAFSPVVARYLFFSRATTQDAQANSEISPQHQSRYLEFAWSASILTLIPLVVAFVGLRNELEGPAIHMWTIAVIGLGTVLATRLTSFGLVFQLTSTVAVGVSAALIAEQNQWFESWEVGNFHLQVLMAAIGCVVWAATRYFGVWNWLVQRNDVAYLKFDFEEILQALAIFASLVFCMLEAMPGCLAQLGLDVAGGFDTTMDRMFSTNSPLGILSISAVAISILAGWFVQKEKGYLVGLLVLGTAIPIKLSVLLPPELTMSGLRWSMAIYGFAMTCLAIGLHTILDRRSSDANEEPARLRSSVRSFGKLTYPNLILTIAPVVVLTTLVAFVQVLNKSVVPAAEGSIFQWMGPEIHYAGPIILIVAMLFIYAVHQSVPKFAWWGSLVFQYFVGVAISLMVLSWLIEMTTGKLLFNAGAFIGQLYGLTILMSLYGVVWLYFRARIEHDQVGASVLPIRWHLTLNIAMPIALSMWGIATVVANPSVLYAATEKIGSLLGLVAVASTVGLSVYAKKSEIYKDVSIVLGAFLICVLGITTCFIDYLDVNRIWISYHTLMIGTVLACGGAVLIQLKSLSGYIPRIQSSQIKFVALFFGVIAFMLAVRGIGSDPGGIVWASGALIGLVLISNVAAINQTQRYMISVASVLSIMTNVLIWNYTTNRLLQPVESVIYLSIISIYLISSSWYLLSMFGSRMGDSNRSRVGHIHYELWGLIAHGSMMLVALAIWFESFLSIPTLFRKLSLGGVELPYVSAVLAVFYSAVSLWANQSQVRKFNWFLLGCGAAICVPAFFVTSSDHLVAWTCVGFSLLYVLIGLGCLWNRHLGGLARSCNIPISNVSGDLLPEIRNSWVSQVGLLIAACVALGSLVLLVFADERLVRHLVTFSQFGFVFGLGALARKNGQHRFRIAALSLATVGVVLVSWLDVPSGISNVLNLQRLVRTLIGFAAVSFLYGIVLPRLTWDGSKWIPAIRQMTIANLALAVGSVVVVLVVECFLTTSKVQDFSPLSQSITVAVAIVLIATGLIAGATLPRLDPLSLSVSGRKIYVYVAQAVVGLLFLHLMITTPELFNERLRVFWPYIILIVSFLAIIVGRLLEKSGLEVVGSPFITTASLIPLGILVAMAIAPNQADLAIVLFVAGLIYMINSVVFQSLLAGCAAAILGNLSLWQFYTKFDGFGFFEHPQLWLIPPSISVIAASQYYKKSIASGQLVFIRYIGVAVIFLSSTSEIFILGLGDQIWPPILLALLSVIGIMIGIAMRIRAFLYLGTCFLFMAVLTMVHHAGKSFDHVWPWWAFGIGLGILILTFFGLLEKKRPEIEKMVKQIRQWEL